MNYYLPLVRGIPGSVSVCWLQEGCGYVVESNGCRQVFECPSYPITAAYCAQEAG